LGDTGDKVFRGRGGEKGFGEEEEEEGGVEEGAVRGQMVVVRPSCSLIVIISTR